MNRQKSLKNVGTLVKKKRRFRISQATLTIILIQLCRRIKSLGVPVIRYNLTSRHWAFLETAWAANEQKWWHTNRLIVRITRLLWENVFFCQWYDWCGCSDESICVYYFVARVWHTGRTSRSRLLGALGVNPFRRKVIYRNSFRGTFFTPSQ